MKKSTRVSAEAQLGTYLQQFAGLRKQLYEVQYFCRGTVLQRMMKCGQQRCACHEDPTKRHGPYFEWTYKVNGKTVNQRIQPEEAAFYKTATEQYRRLKSVLKRMEILSRKAVGVLARQAYQGDAKNNHLQRK
jgi:hypothetical protein